MRLGNIKLWQYSFVLLIIALTLKNYYYDSSAPTKALSVHFKGPVEKIYYDGKKHPYVFIQGKEYELYGMMWHRSFLIHKDDTIIKKKGDLRIFLIKPNTRDTIYFNDYD